MLGFDRLVDHLETFLEQERDVIFVADTQVFQIERRWVTSRSAYRAPLGRRRAVRVLDEIQHFLDVTFHALERQATLARATLMIRVLTAHTGGHHGHGPAW